MIGETRFDLIDRLIAEQQYLSAVERFAQKHEQTNLPLQAKYYRDLIPLTKPGKGQQYSFEVYLDRCTGCKACVSACHSLDGLEENETWRDVGLIVGELDGQAYQQNVTCHHCLDLGCLEGCPVMAYQKESETGIVRHLDDQCIGCQYCTMKCPYDVPKYSERLGIVRKCDLCHDRLVAGEAPACVQACPHGVCVSYPRSLNVRSELVGF
jgi:formate dehydrogenase iron-sulfur subunit